LIFSPHQKFAQFEPDKVHDNISRSLGISLVFANITSSASAKRDTRSINPHHPSAAFRVSISIDMPTAHLKTWLQPDEAKGH